MVKEGKTGGRLARVVWGFLQNTILQPDLGVGAIIGVGIGFWAYYKHSVRLDEGIVLTTDIGASVGLLAVTLAAMTLILGFLQGFYASLIRRVRGGAKAFFYPFKVIAVVSGAAAISGIVSSLDANTSSRQLSSILFGLSVGLLIWAIIGAVQLVFIFVGHGTLWVELDQALSRRPPKSKATNAENAETPDEADSPEAVAQLFEVLKDHGIDDPEVDLFLAVIKNDVNGVKSALDRGASADVRGREVLERYSQILAAEAPELWSRYMR
jgi:hypothetical protein